MQYQVGNSFYSNLTLLYLVLSILSLCTNEIQTLVSYLRLVKLSQREISCSKEVIYLSGQDYVCLIIEPVSLSLGKFMDGAWQDILVKTRLI